MTVESLISKKIYHGNGQARVWPIPFTFSRVDDLFLLHTDAADVDTPITSNFQVNVTLAGDASVTYPVTGQPLPTGTRLTIFRATPMRQIVNLIYGGAFSPNVLEYDGFDRIVMMIQELQEQASRTVRLPISSEKTPEELLADIFTMLKNSEDALDRANQLFNDSEHILNQAISLQNQFQQLAINVEEAVRVALRQFRELLPIPTFQDIGKVLQVAVVEGQAKYVLASVSWHPTPPEHEYIEFGTFRFGEGFEFGMGKSDMPDIPIIQEPPIQEESGEAEFGVFEFGDGTEFYSITQ